MILLLALLLDSSANNQYFSSDGICDENTLHSNSSMVVIGDLDYDVIQHINQPEQRIILIDIYGNYDGINFTQLATLNTGLKIFPLNLCINKKTVMHLEQLNIAKVKMVVGNRTKNKYHDMKSGIVMKCVINLLTLMGNSGAIELLVHETGQMSMSMRVSHGIGDINIFDNLQPDYRRIDQNIMKNYQLYFTTYNQLHNLTFRQRYTIHHEM